MVKIFPNCDERGNKEIVVENIDDFSMGDDACLFFIRVEIDYFKL